MKAFYRTLPSEAKLSNQQSQIGKEIEEQFVKNPNFKLSPQNKNIFDRYKLYNKYKEKYDSEKANKDQNFNEEL